MAESPRERQLQLGADGHLVGTLSTLPGAGSDLGVLLFNAGVIHRIGPHRINVKMARALAQQGIASLRLDLSGLGDSRRSSGTDSMLDQVRLDIRAAIDVLTQQAGVRRVVIIGICSGAEYGYQYALDDARVAGLVMVDGYSFGNTRTRLLRYLLRLKTLTWPVLRKAVMGRVQRLRERGQPEVPQTPVDYGLPVVTVADFGHGLAERVRHGARILLIFTGSILQRYNHASQFRDTMKAAGLSPEDAQIVASDAVRCDFMPEIDHTLSTLDGQRRFIERVLRWLAPMVAGEARQAPPTRGD